MRIVVDTNVLWDRAAMGRLQAQPERKVLPAVAFAERARQFRKRGWSIEALWSVLHAAGMEVEPLDHAAALRASMAPLDDRQWSRLARDAFIAGHVGPGDILWTKDVQDFLAVGVPRGQVHAI